LVADVHMENEREPSFEVISSGVGKSKIDFSLLVI
jgi:hypothetical protein